MTSAFSTVDFEVGDSVAWVTLNRPEVLNALNLQMRDDLWTILDAVDLDPDIVVVIFRGAGERAFCSGADISDFGTAPSYEAARRARLERDLWDRLRRTAKPLIAAIQGYALGAGCELALLCDLRIASDDARLGLPETALGYIPTAGGSQTLPRTIGRGRALDMILSAEAISAEQALAWGLVQRVVPRAELYAAAAAWAQRLLSFPRDTVLRTKRALVEGAGLSLEEAIALEARLARLA